MKMNLDFKNNKKSLVTIIVVGAVLLASLLGVIIYRAVQPKGIVVAVSTLPDSLNPVLEQNVSGLNANELIFDGLCNFEVDPETKTKTTEFALAESIEQDPVTKKIFTVTLKDVNWHDETPLTADDVVYSFDAYTLEENKSPKRDYLKSFIKSVEAIDDRTVEIEFRQPIPEFNAYKVLTFKIIPCRFEGKDMNVNMREGELERQFAVNPIGTGPFKLSSWEIGKWLTFDANGLYFRKRPEADTLVIKRIIDPVVRINELRKGRVNLVPETDPMDHKTVAKNAKIDITSFMPYAFYSISINTKLFPKVEGRQAMSYALQRKDLIPGITDADEGVCLNYGPYPSNLFQVKIPEYCNDLPNGGVLPNNLEYDLKLAKRYAKSGNVSGQNATLMYPDSMGEFGEKLAKGVAKQLEEIGLKVEVKKTGDNVFNRMVYKDRDYELALIYHDGFDDAYSEIDTMYKTKASVNITGIADQKLNTLLEKVLKANTVDTWKDCALQVYDRAIEVAPEMWLCTLQKDIYSYGLSNVNIATDNYFLSVEDWEFKE